MVRSLKTAGFPVFVLAVLATCATGPSVRDIEAKLMARNYLHGHQSVQVASGVDQPRIPYRFMENFKATKDQSRPAQAVDVSGPFLWKVTLTVSEGEHKGNHTVYVHPEKQKIVGWVRSK